MEERSEACKQYDVSVLYKVTYDRKLIQIIQTALKFIPTNAQYFL